MSTQTNNMSTLPARCPRGHELTARTTTIAVTAGADSQPAGRTCVRCLRAACRQAHYDRHSDPVERGKALHADELAETRFTRQASWRAGRQAAGWTKRVHFVSGWGYDREDSTPEPRATRSASTSSQWHR